MKNLMELEKAELLIEKDDETQEKQLPQRPRSTMVVWQQPRTKQKPVSTESQPTKRKRKPVPSASLANRRPDLAKEWSHRKNEETALEVGTGSHVFAWWECSAGHEWQERVDHRTKRKKRLVRNAERTIRFTTISRN